jgi:hypothetical protein
VADFLVRWANVVSPPLRPCSLLIVTGTLGLASPTSSRPSGPSRSAFDAAGAVVLGGAVVGNLIIARRRRS